jgi:threonine dehydrogenase-like Zn-dependent dehydrogenase
MRALVFRQSPAFDPRRPEPRAGDGNTSSRFARAGDLLDDLEICKGYMNFAGVLGHEFVGAVISSPNKDLVGQRVAGEINCVCGRCDLCSVGLEHALPQSHGAGHPQSRRRLR